MALRKIDNPLSCAPAHPRAFRSRWIEWENGDGRSCGVWCTRCPERGVITETFESTGFFDGLLLDGYVLGRDSRGKLGMIMPPPRSTGRTPYVKLHGRKPR